jgi:hypothetical protein
MENGQWKIPISSPAFSVIRYPFSIIYAFYFQPNPTRDQIVMEAAAVLFSVHCARRWIGRRTSVFDPKSD